MENRFKQLRYKDRYLLHEEISISQLAKKMEISKATISKLEREDDYDARISIIKKYKECFPDITYDYLLGATWTRHKQYNPIEEKLPFGNGFYQNLEQLFKEHKHMRNHAGDLEEYMTLDNLGIFLEAFLNNPTALLEFLNDILLSLLEIYRYSNDKSESSHQTHKKDYFVSGAKTDIAQKSLAYIMESVYPLLCNMFDCIIEEDKKAFAEYLETSGEFLNPADAEPF
ncbi:MAG: helix-turn-helix domain-containing protein [Acetatifactor sp.]|nr:helix-turn-helix domain-containing protein [Acetatifactor sp.]